MAEHDLHQHVEISNGDRTVAAAEVTTSPGPERTAVGQLGNRPGGRPAQHEIPAAVPVGGVLRQAKRRLVAGFPSSRGCGSLPAARPGRRSRARARASG